MAGPYRRVEDLPAEIPVFPLPEAVLLPHGQLPLNIFEPRYLAMVEDALGAGRVFGMIQPLPIEEPPAADPTTVLQQGAGNGGSGPAARRGGAESAMLPPLQPAQGPLYGVGCLGRITSFAETEDGRLLITLRGLARFRVLEELPGKSGYRRMRVDYRPYGDDFREPHAEGTDRTALIAALRPYLAGRGVSANWVALQKTPDAMLVTTLSMVCPFDVREKQALLETPTGEERASMLITLLQMAVHSTTTAPTGKPS